jgi:hypothetical protein
VGKWKAANAETNFDVEYRSDGTWVQYVGKSGSFQLIGPKGTFRVIDASNLEIDGSKATYKVDNDALEVVFPVHGLTKRYRRPR